MNEKDKRFLQDCCYFWLEKGDMERFTGFDMERLRKLDPMLAERWKNYQTAVELLNIRATDIEEEFYD
jgi:hypothetical protein